jgi:hypothetical protein
VPASLQVRNQDEARACSVEHQPAVNLLASVALKPQTAKPLEARRLCQRLHLGAAPHTAPTGLVDGSPACMTISEARAKFSKAHLVWVGTNHCWTFGTVAVHSRPSLAEVPVPSPRPPNRGSASVFLTTRNRGSAYLPHDPKSIAAASMSLERHVNIRHVSRKNIPQSAAPHRG